MAEVFQPYGAFNGSETEHPAFSMLMGRIQLNPDISWLLNDHGAHPILSTRDDGGFLPADPMGRLKWEI